MDRIRNCQGRPASAPRAVEPQARTSATTPAMPSSSVVASRRRRAVRGRGRVARAIGGEQHPRVAQASAGEERWRLHSGLQLERGLETGFCVVEVAEQRGEHPEESVDGARVYMMPGIARGVRCAARGVQRGWSRPTKNAPSPCVGATGSCGRKRPRASAETPAMPSSVAVANALVQQVGGSRPVAAFEQQPRVPDTGASQVRWRRQPLLEHESGR